MLGIPENIVPTESLLTLRSIIILSSGVIWGVTLRLNTAFLKDTDVAPLEAASRKGIRWLDMPKNNIDGWNKLQNIIPFMHPQIETLGAGISETNNVELGGYRYPTLTVYEDASEEEVYNFIKAIYKSTLRILHGKS